MSVKCLEHHASARKKKISQREWDVADREAGSEKQTKRNKLIYTVKRKLKRQNERQ